MADADLAGCDAKTKEIQIVVENGGGQADQLKASAESWLTQVKDTFHPHHKMRQLSAKVCIYRVPKLMRICKPEAYDPLVVSLGPYHHKMNPKLSAMDEHKLEAVHRILRRLEGLTIIDIISEIEKLESEIRECYEEAIEWNKETLSWMLAMDACFILEFIRSSMVRTTRQSGREYVSLFQNFGNINQTRLSILYDIMKMENQIPLFILIRILQLEFGNRGNAVSELAAMLSGLDVFTGYPFSFQISDENMKSQVLEHIKKGGRRRRKKSARHLLDLKRRVIKDLLTHSSTPESAPLAESEGCAVAEGDLCEGCADAEGDLSEGCAVVEKMNNFLQRLKSMNVTCWVPRLRFMDTVARISLSARETECIGDSGYSTPRAELLKRAGIKFKPGEAQFLKRRFRSSTLFLPQIKVGDNTETVLRNLMALEECQRCAWAHEETVISHYIRLLEDLIDSERDVSILKKANIIKSWLGRDEEIANIFNHLGKGTTFGSVKQFEEVGNQARLHYKNRWKVWISLLRQDHCSNPWYIVSLVAAVILLGMTVVQTIYSVKN